MKPLPQTLRKNGFAYTLVLHEGGKYIYEQRVAENDSRFEVFLARIKPKQVFAGGRAYPERHIFPRDEDFGKTAWTCWTYEKAWERFKGLYDNIDPRHMYDRSNQDIVSPHNHL